MTEVEVTVRCDGCARVHTQRFAVPDRAWAMRSVAWTAAMSARLPDGWHVIGVPSAVKMDEALLLPRIEVVVSSDWLVVCDTCMPAVRKAVDELAESLDRALIRLPKLRRIEASGPPA